MWTYSAERLQKTCACPLSRGFRAVLNAVCPVPCRHSRWLGSHREGPLRRQGLLKAPTRPIRLRTSIDWFSWTLAKTSTRSIFSTAVSICSGGYVQCLAYKWTTVLVTVTKLYL